MGLFICEKCEAVENTALGYYWEALVSDTEKRKLCSQCHSGKWHGRFPREHYIEHWGRASTSERLALKREGNFINFI